MFPPELAPGVPLHMFVNGGYWRSGSKDAHTLVAEPVLAAGGIAALIGYDLMPQAPLAQIVEQVRNAARYLCDIAPDIRADASRFTASGHSTGAHLVSLLAAEAPGDRSPPRLVPLKGLFLVSGIYDLSGIPESFLKSETRMTADEAAAWSPLSARHLNVPVRILTHGKQETSPYRNQAAALDALLRERGQATEMRPEDELNHLSVVLDLADPQRPLGRRLARMVAES